MRKPTKTPVRVTIDTNIFISILLGSKNCCKIFELFIDSTIDVIISFQLFAELNEVIREAKFKQLFKSEDIKKLNDLLNEDAEWVFSNKKIGICRDIKDNMVLECAVAGKSDFIITGDKDLLTLKSFKKTRIITPHQFLKIKL